MTLDTQALRERAAQNWCICVDDYKRRGRTDPQCRHDELEDLARSVIDLCDALVIADSRNGRLKADNEQLTKARDGARKTAIFHKDEADRYKAMWEELRVRHLNDATHPGCTCVELPCQTELEMDEIENQSSERSEEDL